MKDIEMKKIAIYKVYIEDECIFEGTIDAQDRRKMKVIYPKKKIKYVKTGSYVLEQKF